MLSPARRLSVLVKLAERRPHAVDRAMQRMSLSEAKARRLVRGLTARARHAPAGPGWARLPGGYYAAIDRYGGKTVVKTILAPGMHPKGREYVLPLAGEKTKTAPGT